MSWRPAHDAHAIERTGIAFQFAEPIPTKRWQALLNEVAIAATANGFNSIVEEFELPMPPVLMGPPAPGIVPNLPLFVGGVLGQPAIGQAAFPPFAPNPGNGRSFRLIQGSEVREEFSLHRQRFAYASNRYDRWRSFKGRVQSALEVPLDDVLRMVNLAAIKLEYWDRFIFEGALTDVDYGELLQTGSSHLPAFPATTHELWHSHVGYFSPSEFADRRLVNANVDIIDILDPPPTTDRQFTKKRSAGVYSMAQDAAWRNSAPATFSEASTVLDDLHALLKTVLGTIVTPAMAERIALGTNGT